MFLISSILRPIREYRILKPYKIVQSLFSGYKYGFTQGSLDVCGITKDNYKDFLTDKDYILGHPYNGPYTSIIDNKLYLPMLLHRYKDYLPEYYYYIDEFGLLPLSVNGKEVGHRLSIDAFFQTLQEKKILCLKHTHSSVGEGFMLVKQNDEGQFFLNNSPISKAELEKLLLSLRQYIVTEYIVQHSYASAICSSSLNTIRLLCVWDYEKKEFFVARSFHRFGCNGNVVDNIGSGNGILVFVDVESGKLTSEGSFNFNHGGDKYVKDIIHPDHNVKLEGIQIPNYSKIKSKILEIANSISYLCYIGFDVAVTEEGFKIIELNSRSSLDVSQQRKGFLTDPRIRKVLKK